MRPGRNTRWGMRRKPDALYRSRGIISMGPGETMGLSRQHWLIQCIQPIPLQESSS